jgi:predicted aldo/keto reductase-like oxidoreductase
MKNFTWNRRNFITRSIGCLGASQLLSSSGFLFAQSDKAAPKPAASGKVITRTLGKTGITVPVVSMGVMNADSPGVLHRAYEVGIRLFDTAAGYQMGRNEEMVGNVIKELGVRDKVIIVTKEHVGGGGFGAPVAGDPAEMKAKFRQDVEASLKRLQMDYVDILYIHGAGDPSIFAPGGVFETSLALKKEGKARFVGFSTHSPELMLTEAAKAGNVDVVQFMLNYPMSLPSAPAAPGPGGRGGFGMPQVDYPNLLKAMDAASKKGIGLIAMKTQAGGTQRPDAKITKPLSPVSQTALLKWVLQHENVTTCIPGFTTYDQLQQNFSVASSLTLTPEEKDFLTPKNAVAAEFCHQCGECRADCSLKADIPTLMRSHMYAVQYARPALASDTLASIAPGQGLAACSDCTTCKASCRKSVNIPRKIEQLKELSAKGVLTV